MPAQQSPSFKLAQAIVQVKANLGLPARGSHIGDKLLLRLADFAFGVGFDLERVKLGVVQQDQIGNAGLDTKPDKPGRLDMVPPTAICRMKPYTAAHAAPGKVLAHGALNVGFVERQHW
jgi:hypothetical protein